MSISAQKYILSPMLLASSFLVCLPAMAQQLNRTGGSRSGGNCLCLKAMKEGVAASWLVTRNLVDDLQATQASDIVQCADGGGVFMGGTTCMSVASLRGPKGPTGEQGPNGADGRITWIPLSYGDDGGGSWGGGGGGGGGFGVDVNFDGIGDYATFSEARADGHRRTSSADNCNNCGRGVSSNDSGSNDSTSSRVICTELYRQGYLPRHVYVANVRHYMRYAQPNAARAYHAWGVPYVKLMRKSKLATAIVRPVMSVWAHQMAYEIGAIETAPKFGRLTTGILTRVHQIIGNILFPSAGTTNKRPMISKSRIVGAEFSGALALVPSDFFPIK